jgi:alpha-tubulin suppressor-like RCC1 family protein
MKTNRNLTQICLLGVALLPAGWVTAQNFDAWPVIKIAAGGAHTLFIKGDGTMWGMGDNSSGQLGLGASVTNVNIPQMLTNGVGAIAAGYAHSMFLSGKNLWAMGGNAYGQLGDGTTVNQYVPEKVFSVSGNVRFTKIAAGAWHSLFTTLNLVPIVGNVYPTLYAMGANGSVDLGIGSGQLGDGTYTDHHTPEAVVTYSSSTPNVTAVAGGFAHSLFIKSDGSLWGTGNYGYGQLGLFVPPITYYEQANTNRPVMIFSGNGSYDDGPVVTVAAGAFNSLFITSDGSLWVVGDDTFDQLDPAYGGSNVEEIVSPLGYPFGTITGVATAVAGGRDHSLFVLSDGSLWGMGYDGDGGLGLLLANGVDPIVSEPVQIASDVVAVAAGEYFSLFLKSDGSLWGMGANYSGQLGTGDYTDRFAPVEIVAPPPQISIIPYGANAILTWPSNAASFHLQSTTNLAPPAVWSTNNPAPVLIGNLFEVFTPISGPKKYYRLSQ